MLHKAPGLLGSGLGSISFIFVFLGHNSLLSLFNQSTTSQELVPPAWRVRFQWPYLCPIIADGLQYSRGRPRRLLVLA